MSPRQIWEVGAKAHPGYFHRVLRAEANQRIRARRTLPSRKPVDPAFSRGLGGIYLPVDMAQQSHLLSFRSLSHLPTGLLPLLEVIMPRGQKSKLRARERRHQAQVEPQNPVGAQAIVGVGEEFPSSFSSWKAIS